MYKDAPLCRNVHRYKRKSVHRCLQRCSPPSLPPSLSPFLPYDSAGVKKFLISFDDGDEIWTGLPAKDVRLAVSDLATAGGVARDGVLVHVVSHSGQNCALA